MLNTNFKNEFIKIYGVLKKGRIAEEVVDTEWESGTQNIAFTINNGQAVSNGAVYNVDAGTNPNTLILDSDYGVLRTTTSGGDYIVEKIEEVIFDITSGKRGYNGHKFVAVRLNNPSEYIDAGMMMRTGFTVDELPSKEQIYTQIATDIYATGYVPFVARIADGSGYIYYLVRPEETFPGYNTLNYETHPTEKYRVIYDLYDHIDEEMVFAVDSTITIQRIIGRLI